MAQLVEYDLAKVGVAGSSPVCRSSFSNLTVCDSGSVGRVQPCQGWGRGFEPRLSLLKHDSSESCFSFFILPSFHKEKDAPVSCSILSADFPYDYTSVPASSSSVLITPIPSSSSCFAATSDGASSIISDASFTFGNAMTSRMLSTFAISITRRSSP